MCIYVGIIATLLVLRKRRERGMQWEV